ncbi:MAG: dienelactone hydrolase family protein [Halomonadaceae bacterium]|uniref:Dienelactone hydrolase family protein n=1 Tax=Halomonas colorata TaxID=2742615 RepID=A0ABR9G271_9GAMM|nr:dienelactone hydrolase family protein [Halomonas colorata]MBE0464994.1 dienelactone hydrolase family protein [Halomonas colorata]
MLIFSTDRDTLTMIKTLSLSSLVLTCYAANAFAFSPMGENIAYTVNDEAFEGYYVSAVNESKGTVLIIHDWDGVDDYERQRADMLANEGYDAFAIDLFGAGNRPQAVEDKQAATSQLYEDRARMRELTLAGLTQAREQGAAESTVLLGYCFGGAAALEIARSGEADDVIAYSSFHGGLATPEGQDYPQATPPIFIAHGGADESVSLEEVTTLMETLEAAEIAYEVNIYSGAPHAFSVFDSDRYQARADERSWASFTQWLNSVLE